MNNGDIEIVYVPWYLEANIKAINKNLDILIDCNIEDNDEINISRSDLIDFKILNAYINEFLFTNNFNSNMFKLDLRSYINSIGAKEFNNRSLELLNILSGNNTSIKNTYTMKYNNNTVFVILKKGSTNFMKFNNKDDLKYLYEDLINFMFKHFNARDIYLSMYFKKFTTLTTKK